MMLLLLKCEPGVGVGPPVFKKHTNKATHVLIALITTLTANVWTCNTPSTTTLWTSATRGDTRQSLAKPTWVMETVNMIPFFTLLLTLWVSSATTASERKPHPFPVAATFKANLITTGQSTVCPNCVFEGVHHINSAPDKMYGHVAWVYGPVGRPEVKFNFKNVFLGNVKEMYIMHGGKANETNCVKVKPYPRPIFDYNWSAKAKFEGVEWFHGTYCYKFSNVYPYWVQGHQELVEYYEGVFDERPRGYKNHIEDMWFEWENEIQAPHDKHFLNVLNLQCH